MSTFAVRPGETGQSAVHPEVAISLTQDRAQIASAFRLCLSVNQRLETYRLPPVGDPPAIALKTGAHPSRSHLFSLSVVYGTMVAVTSAGTNSCRGTGTAPSKRRSLKRPEPRSPDHAYFVWPSERVDPNRARDQ
jgi:hypothetical protein